MKQIKVYKVEKRMKIEAENMNKRGQVTIFVILAILIVGALLVLFVPQIRVAFGGSVQGSELKNCLE